MQRNAHIPLALGGLLLVAVLAGLTFVAGPAQAQEDGPSTAVCVQAPNTPTTLDEAFVERFMNEQLAQGRTRFESLTGLSTVICAW